MFLNIGFPPRADTNGFCRHSHFFNVIERVFAARKLSINLVLFAHWQHQSCFICTIPVQTHGDWRHHFISVLILSE